MQNFDNYLAHSMTNAFRKTRDPTVYGREVYIMSPRDSKPVKNLANNKSIVSAIYTRIAIDCAQQTINHVKLNEEGQYEETIDSGINHCLTVAANIDQTGRSFIQDIVESVLDEGTVAVCPIDTDDGDIKTMRVGRISAWHPKDVTVELYDDNDGLKKEVLFPKSSVAIIENPFYSIMNSSTSTMRRLIRKLNLIDVVDEQAGSGKLDLIVGLPYNTRTEAARGEADKRREEIERQIVNNKYGIAFVDGNEKITQLNRSIENNLLKSAEYLQGILYSQLGITEDILNGSADASVMANYMSRIIEPLLTAILDEFKRKFISDSERKRGESFMYFSDPFKLVPASSMADLTDKLTRNEIFSSNEIRAKLGMKPSKDPKADELINKNINHPEEGDNNGKEPNENAEVEEFISSQGGKIQNG